MKRVLLNLGYFLRRNIGVGTSTAAGRIGSICCPFLVYTVSTKKEPIDTKTLIHTCVYAYACTEVLYILMRLITATP